MEILTSLFSILIFPGLLFAGLAGMAQHSLSLFIVRRCKRLAQRNVLYHAAELIRLFAQGGGHSPAASLAGLSAAVTALLLIPIYGEEPPCSFEGSLMVATLILALPHMLRTSRPETADLTGREAKMFFSGWLIFFFAVIGPAIIADSTNIDEIASYFTDNPAYMIVNIPALFAALLSLAMLFPECELGYSDLPESACGQDKAWTILSDWAVFIAKALLISAVFTGGTFALGHAAATTVSLIKTAVLAAGATMLACWLSGRNTAQRSEYAWQFLLPVCFFQIIVDIIFKGLATP